MEKEQFVAVDTPTWWLLERDLDHRMEDLRRELGATFGWTEPTWYTERARLEELYEFIAGRGASCSTSSTRPLMTTAASVGWVL